MRRLSLTILILFSFLTLTALQSLASCDFDFDFDGDCDGTDLSTLMTDLSPGDLENFAVDFGRIDCPTRRVGPAGGIFKFHNGVILDIPAGAVDDTVEIEITDIALEQVDQILSERRHASHAKRCLGGFTATPHGLEFNTSITATIPVIPLQPGGLPVQAYVSFDENEYWLFSTDLLLMPEDGIAVMKLDHFSTTVAIELAEGLEPGDPCRSKKIHVISSHNEFGVVHGDLDCALIHADESITFLDCPDSPIETVIISEMTDGCPENMTVETRIDPPSPEVYLCDSTDLKAIITGKDGDQELFSGEFLPDEWMSEDTDIAYFPDPQTGEVHAKEIPGPVYIRALNPFEDAGDWLTTKNYNAILVITAPGAVDPHHPIIRAGESIQLQAAIQGDFPLNQFDSSNVIWEGNGHVNVDNNGVVEATSEGESLIQARYEHCGQLFEAEISVTVAARVWSTPQVVASCDDPYQPTITAETNGDWHILYECYSDDSFFLNYINSTTTPVATTLATYGNCYFTTCPPGTAVEFDGSAISVDNSGVLHVAFSVDYGNSLIVKYMNKVPSGTWTAPQTIASGGGPISIAVDSNGIWHLLFVEYTGTTIKLNYVNATSLPNASTLISYPVCFDYPCPPGTAVEFEGGSIATDSVDGLHVTYGVEFENSIITYYTHRDTPISTWSAAALLLSGSGYVSLTVDSYGIRHFVYTDYSDFSSIRYFSDTSPNEIIASGSFGASIAADISGRLHVTFPAGSGNIMYMFNE